MEDTWYREGLRFGCRRCGRCCGGEPGSVWLSAREIDELAHGLGLGRQAFLEIYTRAAKSGAVGLRERKNADCIFFDRDAGCSVYAMRPRQCRTWPFWRAVVRSPDRWRSEARNCPGMNSGRLHSSEEVRRLVENDGTSGEG